MQLAPAFSPQSKWLYIYRKKESALWRKRCSDAHKPGNDMVKWRQFPQLSHQPQVCFIEPLYPCNQIILRTQGLCNACCKVQCCFMLQGYFPLLAQMSFWSSEWKNFHTRAHQWLWSQRKLILPFKLSNHRACHTWEIMYNLNVTSVGRIPSLPVKSMHLHVLDSTHVYKSLVFVTRNNSTCRQDAVNWYSATANAWSVRHFSPSSPLCQLPHCERNHEPENKKAQ